MILDIILQILIITQTRKDFYTFLIFSFKFEENLKIFYNSLPEKSAKKAEKALTSRENAV